MEKNTLSHTVGIFNWHRILVLRRSLNGSHHFEQRGTKLPREEWHWQQ